MLIFIKSFAVNIAAAAIVFAGITFLNQQFIPSVLAPVYQNTSKFVQLMLMLFLSALPANYLFAMGYRIAGPTTGGVAYVFAVILAMTTVALLLESSKPNLMIFAGLVIMMAGASLIVLGINK